MSVTPAMLNAQCTSLSLSRWHSPSAKAAVPVPPRPTACGHSNSLAVCCFEQRQPRPGTAGVRARELGRGNRPALVMHNSTMILGSCTDDPRCGGGTCLALPSRRSV